MSLCNRAILLYVDRPSPEDLSLTVINSMTTVRWKFAGEISNLFQFQVELDGEKMTKPPHCREATISSAISASTAHSVKVIAVFKDQYQTERHEVFSKWEV